jgi:hypothetical protein
MAPGTTTAAPVHLSLRRGLRTNRNSPYYMPPSLSSIGNYPMSASIYLVKGREKSLLAPPPLDLLQGDRARCRATPSTAIPSRSTHPRRQVARPGRLVRQLPESVPGSGPFDKDESVDLDFFIRRLKYAQESRDGLIKRQGPHRLSPVRRRIRRPAGPDHRPLRRLPGVPDPLRRGRVPARADHASPAYPLPRVQHL